jgi:multidrug efflux pump subunit AcrA (membrane-fusion protein)
MRLGRAAIALGILTLISFGFVWEALAVSGAPFEGAQPQDLLERFRQASPAARKALIDKIPQNEQLFHKVGRGDVLVTVVERGEVEPAQQTDIICRVRSRSKSPGTTVASTIKWVVDDGTWVKKGDLILQLDDAGLKEHLANQRINVVSMEAALVQAGSELRIAELQSDRELKAAQGEVELAELELERNAEIAAGQQRKLEIKLQQAKAALELAKRAAAAKAITDADMQARQGDVEIAEIDLKNHLAANAAQKRKGEIRLQQAKQGLEIVKVQRTGKLNQAEATQRAKEQIFAEERAKLEELKADIANCEIRAPQDGIVLYYVAEQGRFSGSQSVIAVGEPVREGQRLLRIPDLRQMQVRVKVHEAVAPLLRPVQADKAAIKGQQAQVRIAAMEKLLRGHIKSVSVVPSSSDWSAADVKVYPAIVALDEPAEGLKPGMSAEVTIIVDESRGVLRLPLQAMLLDGNEKVCYVKTGNEIQERRLVTGLADQAWVEIRKGLQEGDLVLLNPRALLEHKGQTP